MLWNEIHSQRERSLAGRLVAGLVRLVGIGVIALGTSWFALPAFAELAERGYGASPTVVTMPEVNPLARVLIGKFFFPAGSAAPGQARLEFNIALRQFSALFVMLYVVMVAGTAAMSIIVEHERNTWQSLIATRLTGWDILRAKMLAAIWRARGPGLCLIALWSVGMLAGAVHPLGFAMSVVSLLVIGAFYAALGVLLGLHIDERKRIDHAMLFLVLGVLPFSGLAIFLPGSASVLLAACSSPFLDLVVSLLPRRRPGPGALGRATATGRDEHQTRRRRPDGAAGLLDCHDRSRARGLRPDAMELPEF